MAEFKTFKRKDGTQGRIRVDSVGKRKPKAGAAAVAAAPLPVAQPSAANTPAAEPTPAPKTSQARPAKGQDSDAGAGGWVLLAGGLVVLAAGGAAAFYALRK